MIVDSVAADDFLLSDGITRPNNVFLLAQEEAPLFIVASATSNMNVGAIHDAQNDLGFSFWFKPTADFSSSSSTDQFLFGKFDDANNRLTGKLRASDGKLAIMHEEATVEEPIVSAETSWNDGQWYHGHVSFSTTNGQRLIIDGGTAVTEASNQTAISLTAALIFGARDDGTSTEGFGGVMANIAIVTDALSTDEEAGLFNGVIPADATEIWLMDEGTGTNVANTGTSGSGNDGTLDAAVTWENHIRVNNSGIQNGTIASFPDYVGNPPSLGREDTRIYVLRDDDDTVTLPIAIERQPQFLIT